jgi:hypothetical protein
LVNHPDGRGRNREKFGHYGGASRKVDFRMVAIPMPQSAPHCDAPNWLRRVRLNLRDK